MLNISEPVPVVTVRNTFLEVEEPEPEATRRTRSVPADFRTSVHNVLPAAPPGYMYIAISAEELAFKHFCGLEFGTTPPSQRRWALTGSATEHGIPIVQYVQQRPLALDTSEMLVKEHVDASPVSTAAGSEDLAASTPSELSDEQCSDSEEGVQAEAFPSLQSSTVAPVLDSFANAEVHEPIGAACIEDDAQCVTSSSPQIGKKSSPRNRRRPSNLKESCPAAQKQSQNGKHTKDSSKHDVKPVKAPEPIGHGTPRSSCRKRCVRFVIIMGVFLVFFAVGKYQDIVDMWSSFYARGTDSMEGVYPRRGEIKPPRRSCECQDSRSWKDEDGDDCFVYKTYIENGVVTRNDACAEGVMSDWIVGNQCLHTCRVCTCEDEFDPDEKGGKLERPTHRSLLALYGLYFSNKKSVQVNVDPYLLARAIGKAAELGYKD